jgi:hypothetical protein
MAGPSMWARAAALCAGGAVAGGEPGRGGRHVRRVWGAGRRSGPATRWPPHVSRLRRLFTDDVTFRRQPDGYLIVVDPDLVDVHRFRRFTETQPAGLRPRRFTDAARKGAAFLPGGVGPPRGPDPDQCRRTVGAVPERSLWPACAGRAGQRRFRRPSSPAAAGKRAGTRRRVPLLPSDPHDPGTSFGDLIVVAWPRRHCHGRGGLLAAWRSHHLRLATGAGPEGGR